MDADDPNENEIERLTEQVTAKLEARADVDGFDIEPSETVGVLVHVRSEAGTEHYRVTLEAHPDGDRQLHWASLGEEPDS